jgi:hypothetical protein
VSAQRHAFPAPFPALFVTALFVSSGLFATLPASAQERPADVFASQEATRPPIDISPRGAFLRALALPGWGHAAIGSYTRGGFYFAVEAATWYTLLRTRLRITEVGERVAFRESIVRARLAAEGVTEFEEIEAGLDADDELEDLRSLQDARDEQHEDLVALGIFILLLSGADAYVSAHLARFPDPLTVEVQPVEHGRVEVGLRLELPN